MSLLVLTIVVSLLLIPITITTLRSIARRLRVAPGAAIAAPPPSLMPILLQLLLPCIILLGLVGALSVVLVERTPTLMIEAASQAALPPIPELLLLEPFNYQGLLWMPNLSVPDAYHVLPLIACLLVSGFGLVMLRQTRGTFRRALKLYVLMLTILSTSISLLLASGAAIVWIVGSVVIVTFQYSFALSGPSMR